MIERKQEFSPLEAARWERHLSRQDLGTLSGVNTRQIQRYENGESSFGNITVNNAMALSAALEVDPVELYRSFVEFEEKQRQQREQNQKETR